MNVGKARFQFAIASRDFADASEEDVPVWTPATTEAFATYGELTDQPGFFFFFFADYHSLSLVD